MTQATSPSANVVKGLKGIKAAESSVCLVNGTEGKLLYRGFNIDELAVHSTFEEVSNLLLFGQLPNQSQLDWFHAELNQSYALPDEVLAAMKQLPTDVLPMSALRTAVSLMGIYDPEAEVEGLESLERKAIRLLARVTTATAAIHRIRQGKDVVPPDTSLSHAANFLYMLNGEKPTEEAAKAMDLIYILHAEHGFNASTFASRVICATLTDVYSAITGAIGALKGKLHGGANIEVLKTLQKLGTVEAIDDWVSETRAAKGKFMGFGHAVYQTADPRAKFLKEYAQKLAGQGDPRWYEMSARMEELVTPLINKNTNVDFYSASVQHYMGIPHDLFTCVFAASRTAGWCAHILEQVADNKIIRPSAEYIGAAERSFVSLADR